MLLKKENAVNLLSRQFGLPQNSGITPSKALLLSAKQSIPLFTQHVPSYPGARPTQHISPEFELWKEKANVDAWYFLMIYQPEPLTNLSHHLTTYGMPFKNGLMNKVMLILPLEFAKSC